MNIAFLVTGAKIAAPFVKQAGISLAVNWLIPSVLQGMLLAAVDRSKLSKSERTVMRTLRVTAVESVNAAVYLVIHAPVELGASVVSGVAFKMGFRSVSQVADGVFVAAISYRVVRLWRTAGKHAEKTGPDQEAADRIMVQAARLKGLRETVEELDQIVLTDSPAADALTDRKRELSRQIDRGERKLIRMVQRFLADERDTGLIPDWTKVNEEIKAVPHKVQLSPSQFDLVNAQIAYFNAMRGKVDDGSMKYAEFRSAYHMVLNLVDEYKKQGGDASKLLDVVTLPTSVPGDKRA
jgi:hypothetical protein